MNVWAFFLSIISSLTTPSCSANKAEIEAPVSTPQVVVLMSTDRPDSNTQQVADNVLAAYHAAGLSAQLFSVNDFGPDFYAPSAYAQRPAAFTVFNDAVLAADVVVLVTPEYNATVPAPLTRVINLLSFPDSFNGKKFVIVSLSVSPWAAARAHEGLKKTLRDLHAVVEDEANLKVAEVHNVTKSADTYAEHAEKVARLIAAHPEYPA